MKLLLILTILLFPACASTQYTKELEQEDKDYQECVDNDTPCKENNFQYPITDISF